MGAANEQGLSHTRRDCAYHMVWIPKYRRRVLFQKSRPEVGALVRQLFERKGCEVVEGGAPAPTTRACA